MSDTMLLGVLRMPVDDHGDIGLMQFIGRAHEAADRIDRDSRLIQDLQGQAQLQQEQIRNMAAMADRLKGAFVGCPYHDDDYEACIQYSGQAPCDPPDGWRLVPVALIDWIRGAQELMRDMPDSGWPSAANQADMLLKAAPSPGQEE